MPEEIREPIRQRSFIAAPLERVFDTITSADGWDAFFTTDMELQPEAGGRIVFRWKDWGPDNYTLDAPGKVLEVVKNKRFVFQWGRKPTTITFDLQAANGGTVVEVTEVGYINTSEGRRNMLPLPSCNNCCWRSIASGIRSIRHRVLTRNLKKQLGRCGGHP